MTRLRCAIYTRKSSEEGLEQEFNSLHAQREACEAFIRSQKHEGWSLISTSYDDGGISGGTMARPALQQLLKDIEAHRIDVVVVYKVDRLTRSLADFARMVELFDKQSVSFVSVTQQFNTTSSMGRLTLNVLLSFAQFEREVTGERIRDKIKASKQKGMWMGGVIPLGYKVEERKLLPEPEEVPLVQHVFEQYLAIGCVRLLMQSLMAEGTRSRKGHVLSRGQLYSMLSNPIYIGKIRHKEVVHEGLHEGIIPEELWQQVQQKLAANRNGIKARNIKRARVVAPLIGKLFDASGERLVLVQAKRQQRRYRYYVSQSLITGTKEANPNGWRIPTLALDRIVADVALVMVQDKYAVLDALRAAEVDAHLWESILQRVETSTSTGAVLDYVTRVELDRDAITLSFSLAALLPTSINTPSSFLLTRRVPMQIKRRGIEMRLVIPSANAPTYNPDPVLIHTIARAHQWWGELRNGSIANLQVLAQRENTDPAEITRMLRLAFIAPELIEKILAGYQPADMNRQKLVRMKTLPIAWRDQRKILGM